VYPPIQPYAHGLLDVGDGHLLYWECCGNPAGLPALVLHGGPGSGCTENARRPFDPAIYRIVLFDQRNSGRSLPHASEPDVDFATNTTAHLIADIERLRAHLGIERWLVSGGSWGCTLGLAYAQAYPARVRALVLAAVATTTRAEIDWITRGIRAFFPAEWARFSAGKNPETLCSDYHQLLMHSNAAIRDQAAQDWCDWETAIVKLHPGDAPHPRYADPRFRLGFARVVTWYWRHAAWLEEGALLAAMPRLAGIPGVLLHGRLDIGTPLATAWHLAQAWPGSRLVVIERSGHDGRNPDMAAALVAALDRFAATPPPGQA
jgi:proline iminopeptidase